MSRTAARTYPPSMLLFGLPVSVNSMRPTAELAVPSALTGRPFTRRRPAPLISLVNGVFQFAVLSSMISTFGESPRRPAGWTNRSMSSAAAGR